MEMTRLSEPKDEVRIYRLDGEGGKVTISMLTTLSLD